MIPKYYGSSIARGHASDIRAAEVPKDYEVKVRKTDREFNGVEYVGDGLSGPVLACCDLCFPRSNPSSDHRGSSRAV